MRGRVGSCARCARPDSGSVSWKGGPVEAITYTPIGVVHSPFTTLAGMPLHAVAATDVTATVEVFPTYQAGLRDIEDFSHLILLCHLHLMRDFALEVTPFLDTVSHGVFATRAEAPERDRPLGRAACGCGRQEL